MEQKWPDGASISLGIVIYDLDIGPYATGEREFSAPVRELD
jgi:hypothetical protein